MVVVGTIFRAPCLGEEFHFPFVKHEAFFVNDLMLLVKLFSSEVSVWAILISLAYGV